jgi:hypothetical protein
LSGKNVSPEISATLQARPKESIGGPSMRPHYGAATHGTTKAN